MAEKRRLQQEVDRTLKRVDEGCDVFFDLHEKLRMQQSPKIENELKREIKKLQKLRDQIKSWQTHADIKEKGPLDEARRRIERGMEIFKQCERESKVKAFSREGLASRQRQAPEERHRERVVELLQQLQREAETAETEIEALTFKKGRKDKDREKKRLQQQLENHRWHIGKLELGLRLLDNEGIDLRSAASMCESVSEYLSNCSNPDYVFDSSIYDCLSPDSEEANTDLDLRDHASETTPPQTETPVSASAETGGGSARGHSQRSSNSSKSAGDSSNSNSSSSNRRALSATQEPEGAAKVNSRRSSSPSNPTGSSKTRQQQQQQQQQQGKSAAAGDAAAVSPPCWSAILQQQGPLQNSAAAVWGRKDQASASPAASSSSNSSNTGSKAADGTPVGSVWKTGRLHVVPDQQQQQQQQQGTVSPPSGDRQQQQQQQQQQQRGASTVNLTPWKSKAAAAVAASSPAATTPPAAAATAASAAAAGGSPAGKAQAKQQQQRPAAAASDSSSSSSKRAPTGTGTPQGSSTAAGGAAASGRGPADLSLVASMVAASCEDRPLPLDADFASAASPSSPFFWPPWIPRGDTGSSPFLHVRASWGAFRVPGNTNDQQPSRGSGAPDCFPKGRLAAAEERQFFKRLDVDALFFAFYFQRGTLKQVYSAQELKAHAWRFHKKYLTWFQRHEEPRVSTDKFEEGTYVYFDYDNGWCSRIKHDFTFEYIFLEDEIQDSS